MVLELAFSREYTFHKITKYKMWCFTDSMLKSLQVIDIKSFVNGLIRKMQDYEKAKRKD
jgi:hypothetical protein